MMSSPQHKSGAKPKTKKVAHDHQAPSDNDRVGPYRSGRSINPRLGAFYATDPVHSLGRTVQANTPYQYKADRVTDLAAHTSESKVQLQPETTDLSDLQGKKNSEGIVIVLIARSEYGPVTLRDHVAIWVEKEGSFHLFDVAGGFRSSTRGSSPIFTDPGALREWLEYQNSASGGSVETFPFTVSLDEAEEIVRRMEAYGNDPRGFECANAASQVLSGVGIFSDIEQTNFPHRLRNQLVQLEESLGR